MAPHIYYMCKIICKLGILVLSLCMCTVRSGNGEKLNYPILWPCTWIYNYIIDFVFITTTVHAVTSLPTGHPPVTFCESCVDISCK